MGVYLSSPITDKESIDGSGEHFVYGASSMQGWRITQEDAHNCIPVFDEKLKTSFFGVYDGHGGSEVAKYCEQHFPNFVKNLMTVQGGVGDDPALFIKNAFLAFDATLTNEDVIKELRQLGGKNKVKSEDGHYVKHMETNRHKEKSRTHLDRLLAQYKNITHSKNIPKKQAHKSSTIRLKSGPLSRIYNSSHQAENRLHSSLLSSLLSPSSCKQDSSSGVLNDVFEVNNLSTTVESLSQNCVDVVSNASEVSLNNNNIEKVTSQSTHEIHCSTGTDEILLPSNNTSLKSTNDLCDDSEGNSESNNSNSEASNTSLDVSAIEVTSDSVDKSLNNSASSNADVTDSISKAIKKIDKVDGDTDTSCDEGDDDDDDMWEDISDEEEDDDGRDRDVPMVDISNEEPGSDSGCTACVVLMQDKKLIVANAGDSRCVLSRAGKAIELSFDHKPEDECEKKRIEKAGGKVTLDGRVNGGLNLSRAIGDHVYKRNKDLPAKEQMITALPDIETAELCDEDQFIVIACDGIWNYMTSQEVVDYVLKKLKDQENRQKPSQICEKLFDHCLAPNTFGDGTGCDNMTCIIILLDTSIKSKYPYTTPIVAANTRGAFSESEDDSQEKLPKLSEKESEGSGSLKRCADSVEVPESKRLKVDEEVA